MKLSLIGFPVARIGLMPVMLILAAGGCVSSPRSHFQAVQSAAEKGDARAEYELAQCYTRGDGVTRDYAKAAEYLRKSADQGYAPAQTGSRLLLCARPGRQTGLCGSGPMVSQGGGPGGFAG